MHTESEEEAYTSTLPSMSEMLESGTTGNAFLAEEVHVEVVELDVEVLFEKVSPF
jgi:cytosine/adenosine deaminase-related metal-dependent hydrolase